MGVEREREREREISESGGKNIHFSVGLQSVKV
jgi:hypothetical protein